MTRQPDKRYSISLEQLLKGGNNLLYILFEQARDGIVVLDEQGKVVVANRQFAEMLGYTDEEIKHLYVWDWDRQFNKKDLETKIKIIDESGHQFATRQAQKDGSLIDVELSNSATVYQGQKLIFCICRDITQRMVDEEKILLLATTDHLTGLLNRREFIRRLKREMQRARRYKGSLALIMYDFDDFKDINDHFGHPEGDQVLKISSELVTKNIRTTDVAARFGGEEFIILLPRCELSEARLVAEKIRRIIAAHHFSPKFSVTASFGVTEFVPGENIESLLKRVDNALYRAKGGNKNRVETLTA
jgi:diguanylate cyclase (GGDEF)-like protein/PAS domain S-box-containing protein